MYLFVTSAMGMFEQQNTRAGTNEFPFSAQHIGSVNIRCNERANSFLYLSRYLVEHFFTLCSFQNIISRCVAKIFFPCLFCFIVVSLLHNLPCFHVSFFILVGFFFRWFYISFSDNQISFILWVWIVWALYYCGEFCFLSIAYTIILFVHTYIHTCTDDIMMRTKCEIRNCGNASDRIWLINAGKCARNSRNLMHFHDHWVNAVNRTHFIYFYYSACLIKDHSICSCTVEKSERISDIN